jgi:hypothetical protein
VFNFGFFTTSSSLLFCFTFVPNLGAPKDFLNQEPSQTELFEFVFELLLDLKSLLFDLNSGLVQFD